jgi:hypothetical protein
MGSRHHAGAPREMRMDELPMTEELLRRLRETGGV